MFALVSFCPYVMIGYLKLCTTKTNFQLRFTEKKNIPEKSVLKLLVGLFYF